MFWRLTIHVHLIIQRIASKNLSCYCSFGTFIHPKMLQLFSTPLPRTMFRCYVFVVVPWVSDKANASVISCYIYFPTVWCYIINHSSKVGILHTLEPCHPKVLGFSRFALGRARSLWRLCTVVEENVTGLWWNWGCSVLRHMSCVLIFKTTHLI